MFGLLVRGLAVRSALLRAVPSPGAAAGLRSYAKKKGKGSKHLILQVIPNNRRCARRR